MCVTILLLGYMTDLNEIFCGYIQGGWYEVLLTLRCSYYGTTNDSGLKFCQMVVHYVVRQQSKQQLSASLVFRNICDK